MKYMLTSLRLWALFALGIHLLAYLLPEETFWSIWPYTFLPPWLGGVLAIGLGLLIIPAWNEKFQACTGRIWRAIPGKNHPRRWFALLALLAIPLFWIARIRHLQWGDANILVIGLSHPEQTVIYNWQAPFTVYLHQRAWALIAQPYFGWGVETVYAVTSLLCGGLFVYILLNLAFSLGRDTPERTLIAGFVLTSGAMQLFFGYVENYTIVSLWILIFLWLGLKALRGEASIWGVALALSLANAFHPSTVFLWPALLYLVWQRYRLGDSGQRLFLGLILPPLIVGNSVLTLMELGDHGLNAFLGDDRPGGGDHIWFVPLFETRSELEQYTMFSLPHLVEWANEHFLISTFGLVTILIVALWAWQKRKEPVRLLPETRLQLWFLGWASLCYLLLTWLWNADYGIRKDWDLFSPSAFVYSLFAALLLIHFLRDKAALAQATLLILGVSALHTAAWIFANTRPLDHLR